MEPIKDYVDDLISVQWVTLVVVYVSEACGGWGLMKQGHENQLFRRVEGHALC